MTLDTWIATGSAIAALISAYYAYRSADVAKKALKLNEADFHEKHDSLTPYLIDAVTWKSGESNIASFACSFTNGATAPNTLIRIDLVIHTLDEQGAPSEIILSPASGTTLQRWSLTPLPIPLNLQPRSTVSGWINFKVPNSLHNGRRIDRYEIMGITSSGDKESIDVYLLKTIEDEGEDKDE